MPGAPRACPGSPWGGCAGSAAEPGGSRSRPGRVWWWSAGRWSWRVVRVGVVRQGAGGTASAVGAGGLAAGEGDREGVGQALEGVVGGGRQGDGDHEVVGGLGGHAVQAGQGGAGLDGGGGGHDAL